MPVREERAQRAASPPQPDVPEVVERVAARVFGTLSAVRRKRIFHPRGDAFSGEFEIDRPLHRYDGIPLLSERGTHKATVRLSRAIGIPAPLPDLLGLAFRIEAGPQDFLLVSSARPAGLRHLLLPTRGDYGEQSYSSILPYRIGDDVRLVGALPVGPLAYDIALVPLRGEWEPFARLRLRAALSAEDSERLELNPWNTSAGLEPIGPFNGLRRSSYAGSQRGRSRR